MHPEGKLKRLNKQQLLAIATDDYGLAAHDGQSNDELIAAILATQAAIADEDAALGGAPPPLSDAQDWAALEADRVLVKFAESPTHDGAMPIKASLNERAFSIPRNVAISLPRAVLRASIDDAVQDIFEQVEEHGQRVMRARSVPRFPYQIIRDPA